MAGGVLNWPKTQGLPGIGTFKGHSFHTSRWDYGYTGGSPEHAALTGLQGKKVGIIGTGATAVQAIPEFAKWAQELYVFQRTPSYVHPRGQHATDSASRVRKAASQSGWQQARNRNFNAHLLNTRPKPAENMVGDGWSKLFSYSALVGGPAQVSTDTIPDHIPMLHSIDYPPTESVRARIDEIIKDKNTAESTKPWYPTWCKRPCFHDDYLPTFNKPNVTLVDTDGKDVDKLTEKGIVVAGQEYDLDLMIFSTGFRATRVVPPASRM